MPGIAWVQAVFGVIAKEHLRFTGKEREQACNGMQVNHIHAPHIGGLLDGLHIGIQIKADAVGPRFLRLYVVVSAVEVGAVDGREEGDGRSGESLPQELDSHVNSALKGLRII